MAKSIKKEKQKEVGEIDLKKSKNKKERHHWNYAHLLLILAGVAIAIFILSSSFLRDMIDSLGSFGYFGVFITGIFFAFLFTAAPATAGFLLFSHSLNPVLIGLIGGLGAMISDILIFSYIKYKLDPDLKYIIEKSGIKKIKELEKTKLRWLIPFLAGFIIASPLPDEAGSFIFGISDYNTLKFTIYSYILNSIGIMIIAFIGA